MAAKVWWFQQLDWKGRVRHKITFRLETGYCYSWKELIKKKETTEISEKKDFQHNEQSINRKLGIETSLTELRREREKKKKLLSAKQ